MEPPDWDTAAWQLLADLQIDRILALTQVRRRYVPVAHEQEVSRWLERLAARRVVNARKVWVPRTARTRLTEEILVVEQPGWSVGQEVIAHRLGLAEMHWRLRPGLRRWEPITRFLTQRRTCGERPDALAEDAAGPFVVEYDHGAYSLSDVKRKQQAFAYLTSRQVWGASSERRLHWLREHLHGQDLLMVAW